MPDKQRIGGASIDKLDSIIMSGECPHSDDDPIPWDDPWFSKFFSWNNHLFSKNKTALLLFSPNQNSHEYASAPRTFYTIGGCQILDGGIYVVGKSSSGHAKIIDEGGDYQASCDIIAQHSELSTLPTIVLGLQDKHFFYYPNGITDDQNSLQLSCIEASLTLDDLLSSLDTHAAGHLQTQEFRKRIWKDAGKWWAEEYAEDIVQYDLLIVLRNRYHKTHTIEAEQITTSGRADIKCVPKEGLFESYGILELKAIRTFGSTGNRYQHAEWEAALRKGAGQAFSYAQDNNASIKVLCVFDMRKQQDQSCINCGKSECEALGVTFKHYSIPNSSQQVRNTRVAKAKNKASIS